MSKLKVGQKSASFFVKRREKENMSKKCFLFCKAQQKCCQKIRRPLRGHQAERKSESLLCKRSFKVKSTVQEKLKLMAWSFLRGLEASSFEVSSFEVLMERCKKENCFHLGPQSVKFTLNPPRSFPPGGLPRPGFFDTFSDPLF